MGRARDLFIRALQRRVGAVLELGDASGVDVEPDRRVPAAQLDGERQPDVAQTDDADFEVVDLHRYPRYHSASRPVMLIVIVYGSAMMTILP